MPSTPINGLLSPDDNSPNDPPIHFDALNAILDTRLVPRFDTIAARNAAITAPQSGMACSVAGALHVYDTAWRWQRRGYAGGVTTDANGAVSVTHGLGAAPTGVHFTLGPLATNILMNVADLKLSLTNATIFTAYLSRTDTNVALTNQLVSFTWTAFV